MKDADAPEKQSASNDDSSPERPVSGSARQFRIRQTASESSTPINFARPLFNVSSSQDESARSNEADDADDEDWRDETTMSGTERRALHASFSSDRFSRPSTPLKIRRRGMMNDKKLTISTAAPAPKSSSGRRVASDSTTSASVDFPARPAAAVRSQSYRAARLALNSSDHSQPPMSPRTTAGAASPRKRSPREEGSDHSAPQSARGFNMPFTPLKSSMLSDKSHSPKAASASPGSGSIPSSAAASSGTGSDKPLLSAPRYGFNPDFQLGSAGSKAAGSKLSPTSASGSSPRSARPDVSPVKPSPTYSGSTAGGVKSMLYSNRMPSTPMSPRAPMHLQRSPGEPAGKVPSTPRTPRTPRSPRTPRTPLTARLPHTPHSAGLSARTGASYQGVLLTTITRTPSDPRVKAESSAAGTSTQAAAQKARNRSASLATDFLGFVRGGAAEIVPRLELRVLERQRHSALYSLDPNQVESAERPPHRHSVANVQPVAESDEAVGEPDNASPRTSAFARSLALSKLTKKRASMASVTALRRGSAAFSSSSHAGYRTNYRERRQTGATTASGRSGRSNRSQVTRRVSMPVATVESLKSNRPSLIGRRLSLAPSSMRGRRDSSMQPDRSDSEDEHDIVGELNSRVNNIADAKRWILGYRTQYDVTAIGPSAMASDVVDDGRAVSAMRRPTYAASVFQQARLMEAERQAGAALVSSSALDVGAYANGSAANLHRTGTPLPFGHLPPRTPGFPKTPLTAFPTEAQLAEEADGVEGPVVEALPQPTWSDRTVHWLKAPLRLVARQVDPKYVLSMMDPREILFPVTLRKVALWIVYGGLITMLVLLDHYYHWWDKFDHAVHGKNLAIMGVLYGFEPAMILVIMLVAKVPDARVVPDRTVLVPRGRNSTDTDSDAESRQSISSDGSAESAQHGNRGHSTIIEEEQSESEQEHSQGDESGIIDVDGHANARRMSGLLRPPVRRMSTRFTAASGNAASTGERRGSEATTNSAQQAPPRTPVFDPRNRRSTIILHEPLHLTKSVDVDDNEMRRPSATSVHHQIMLARSASRESRRASYFSIVAAAAGSRLGAPSPGPARQADDNVDEKDEKDDKDLVIAKTGSGDEVIDEKKAMQLNGTNGNDEVRVPMDGVSHPSLTESTALVIPCHNADVEVLKAVLFAALVHFEPWQIFIVDNGNSEKPPSDMEGAIRSQPMFSRVNYIWLPVGNKNIAQFVGAKAAAVLDLDYVLTIDDDVIIPANFAAPMHIISPTVTAVCYPITAVDHKGDRPLFVGWQDVEYKMSALAKMAESKLCGVLFPHGAASFWRRETMIEVLRRHDLVYFADDVKMGLELQALGQRMGIDASISFETVAPETFLGPPVNGTANYYHQRVRSWEMARHTLYWQFSKRFLFSLNGAKTPVAIGWQKFTQFYNSTTNFIDWIRLPMFVLLGGSGQFWLRSFAFIIFLPVLPLLPYRFIKTRNRPDLHPHMLDMLTFGIYKLLYSVVCILGGIRSMLVFFPNHAHKPNLIEMEKKRDPRCIWLHDDFMANSGGQGDLRDEPQQILVEDSTYEPHALDEEEEQDNALVSALPANSPAGQDTQEVAVVNVTLPSRSPHDELATVHEIR